jgi:hypothetical protein
MAPRGIIEDSEDEYDSLASTESPVKAVTPATIQPNPSSGLHNTTTSTDSAAFRSVYNEQLNAAYEAVSGGVLHRLGARQCGSPCPANGAVKQYETGNTNTPSLTFITDPTKISQAATTAGCNVVISTTEVTPPGYPDRSREKDLWDVPSSPDGYGSHTLARSVTDNYPR